ncbi:MAG: hypothetical protein U0556_08035 [Dehalococcoidia bacterium]
MNRSFRPGRRGFLVGGVGLFAAACSPQQAGSPLVQPRTGAPLTIAVPNSDLAIGKNRFVLAMLDADNRPIPNAKNVVRFYKVRSATTAELKAETTAAYQVIGPGDRGVYVTRGEFDEAGNWGLEVVAALPSGEQVSRVAFTVAEKSKTPAIGTRPPASRQAILPEKPLDKLCTAKPGDPLHDLTVADALAAGKPTLIMIGSPGFCSSATCGPNLDHILAARTRIGNKINWVHVEIYQDAQPPTLAPVIGEWNLPSEPWIFLVDSAGLVVDKFEGGVSPAELDAALTALIPA